MAFVIAVIYTDWRYRRIPNAFTYPVMVAGLVLGAFETVPGDVFGKGLFDHLAGLVVGFLIAYPFYAMGGLKAGDGAIYGALLGGVIALGFIAVRRLRPANGATATMGETMKTWIPYGVALGLGTLIALALELSGRLPGAML